MGPPSSLDLFLASAEHTERLGRWLASRVAAGDTILLDGPIGAGKTHLARALIRARLGRPDEDVPSPTFTLVQTYEAPDGTELWHADLYRLSRPAEVLELGLEEAFGAAICLVEWPDRLGGLRPGNALSLSLAPRGDGRSVRLDAPPAWAGRLAELAGAWHG